MLIRVRELSRVGSRTYEPGRQDVEDGIALQMINAGTAVEIEGKKKSAPAKSKKNEPKAVEPEVEETEVEETEESDADEAPEIPEKVIAVLEANGLSLEDAKGMSMDELTAIDGIGKKTAEVILSV